jgi:hypothetical protein
MIVFTGLPFRPVERVTGADALRLPPRWLAALSALIGHQGNAESTGLQ